jgi:hypothetical protein
VRILGPLIGNLFLKFDLDDDRIADLGIGSGVAQVASYSVNPVPRCPHRRVSAIRIASNIADLPALFVPMRTVIGPNSMSAC